MQEEIELKNAVSRIKGGQARIHTDSGVVYVEVDPAANGRLVRLNGRLMEFEPFEFMARDGATVQAFRANFAGQITAAKVHAVAGIRETADRTV